MAPGESLGDVGALGRFLARCVERGFMPGASYWVGRPRRGLAHGAVGRVAVSGERVTEGTPYALASLTKPLATATSDLTMFFSPGVMSAAC